MPSFLRRKELRAGTVKVSVNCEARRCERTGDGNDGTAAATLSMGLRDGAISELDVRARVSWKLSLELKSTCSSRHGW